MRKTTAIHGLVQSLCACAFLPVAAQTQTQTLTPAFPAPASQTFSRAEGLTSYALPTGPFAKGAMQTTALEGALLQRAWHVQAKGLTTLQIMAPLRDQLTDAGFSVLYECDTFVCGGFDFRFGTDIAAEPAMHVDLGDFRYLAARRTGGGRTGGGRTGGGRTGGGQTGGDGPDHASVIVSRSSSLAFVQLTQIGKGAAPDAPLIAVADPPPGLAQPGLAQPGVPQPGAPGLAAPGLAAPDPDAPASPLAVGLATRGSVALDDLLFASGAAVLDPGEYASLEALAAYLQVNPATRVVLVGHTDASGALDNNIALSRQRAASVRDWMLANYAIPAGQITAEGVGYLAPRDSNQTEQGLTRNRRVEVMLLVTP